MRWCWRLILVVAVVGIAVRLLFGGSGSFDERPQSGHDFGVLLGTIASFPTHDGRPKEDDCNLSNADPERLGIGGFL